MTITKHAQQRLSERCPGITAEWLLHHSQKERYSRVNRDIAVYHNFAFHKLILFDETHERIVTILEEGMKVV